jgi:hypothetical protein
MRLLPSVWYRASAMAADHTATTHAAGHGPAKPPPRARFAPTRWTVVLTAARSDTTCGRDALAQLCQMYWYPPYAHVGRKGHSPPDAKDLTQAFFAQVLEERLVASADREKGRFRSFLLTRLNHFLTDEWDRLKAQKRGGGESLLALGIAAAETRFQQEPVDWRSPVKLYEHRRALTLPERAFDRLQQEYRRDGKAALFGEAKGASPKRGPPCRMPRRAHAWVSARARCAWPFMACANATTPA